MNLSVEISKYPLNENFIPPIKSFIDRLNAYENIKVITSTMSTQVFGEYDAVMDMLRTEMRYSYEHYGRAIFVCKFIDGDLRP